ncbi:RusA family crossover junction endodeoxyribonuclease [Paenibacillus sp. FSL F4-0125]|uniref:RusA family crossover junction endodeoxyribonuclease n=1 Tax=Paenibacillus sp. FSL F4-0125 TaxID=2954730 RepID=UPI0030F92838
MDRFFLLAKVIPVSYNNKKAKPRYKERLKNLARPEAKRQNKYWKKSDGINLYARVYYFHKGSREHDADNISKPVLDSLDEILYEDDCLVLDRQAVKVDLMAENGYSLSDELPSDWYFKLIESIDKDSDFLFIEVGVISKLAVVFGGKE